MELFFIMGKYSRIVGLSNIYKLPDYVTMILTTMFMLSELRTDVGILKGITLFPKSIKITVF